MPPLWKRCRSLPWLPCLTSSPPAVSIWLWTGCPSQGPVCPEVVRHPLMRHGWARSSSGHTWKAAAVELRFTQLEYVWRLLMGRKGEVNGQFSVSRADSREHITHGTHYQRALNALPFRLPIAALSPLTGNKNSVFPATCLHGFQVSSIFQGSLNFK